MNSIRYIITSVFILLLSSLQLAQGQSGAGSFETGNGEEEISANTFKVIYAESFYLGPDANWTIDGEVHIYSKLIWIAPEAKITGSGSLFIHSPADNPFHPNWAAAPTSIDGNDGTFIDVKIILNNKDGLRLIDVSVPELSKATPPTGSKAAALKISKSIDLREDGANIFLNGYDLELSSTGQLLNYNRLRMVVTEDKLAGHLIKNYAAVGSFVFPVGIAIGDYTPANLTPTKAASKVYVTVNSYNAANLNISDETIGMDRVWNIFADQKMNMSYTLSHNKQTNGVAYVDADARIVQNADGGNWIGDVTSLDAESVHTRSDIETLASNTLSGTWFTKFADQAIAPTAVDDQAKMTYGDKLEINVLENDQPGSSAILPSSVKIVVQPKQGTVTVNGDGSVTYTPNKNFVGTDSFNYEITDENGLSDTATVTVTVEPRELFIPNVITPNDDGYNDYFFIIGREAYDRIELLVINRWGNEVYRNDDYNDEWDGTGLNEGTYYPIVRAVKDGQVREFKTYVLIKRQ